MAILVPANTAVAAYRRVNFFLVQADGISPALAEAGGQPQIAVDGAAFTATGIGPLAAVGFGHYYADLTQAAALSPCRIATRYASGNTAECPGDTIQVVAFNPNDAAALGLSRLDAAVGSRLAPATPNMTLAVDSSGAVTVGTSGDKAGYTLAASQSFSTSGSVGSVAGVAFPLHFQNLAVDPGTGGVTVLQNNDKSGYALSAAGLNAIPVADPGGVAGMNTLPAMIVATWRRFYKQVTLTSTAMQTYANDGVTVNTTQACTSGADSQTVAAAI